MKRILLPLLALGLAAGLRADKAVGDPQHGDHDGGPRYEDGRGPGGPEGPEDHDGPGMMEGPEHGGPGMMEPGRMKEKLGLTDEQVKKLKALKEGRGDMKTVRRELRDKMAKLGDMVEDKASEAQLAAALKEIDALQAKMKASMEKQKAEFEAILTATQRAKMMTMHGRGHGMGMGMGMHEGMEHRGHEPEGDDDKDEHEHGPRP
jgi:Spy/CpxP family protein refolding chaperone